MLRARLAAWATGKLNGNGGPYEKGLQPNVAVEIADSVNLFL